MKNEMSPIYQMRLIEEIEKRLWETFDSSKYKNVEFYLEKWRKVSFERDKFTIYDSNDGNIDLKKTLHGIDTDMLLKIAIDLGIETPDFIPSIPIFKNVLKENYKTAHSSFERAFKQIEIHPDIAISLANSTLESIVKHILQDNQFTTIFDRNKTLYDLTQCILKEFKLFPKKEAQDEIKQIGSGLLKVVRGIESIRSEKTASHGKMDGDYIVQDSLYTYFIINSIATVGLFLISFYEKKYKKEGAEKKSWLI